VAPATHTCGGLWRARHKFELRRIAHPACGMPLTPSIPSTSGIVPATGTAPALCHGV